MTATEEVERVPFLETEEVLGFLRPFYYGLDVKMLARAKLECKALTSTRTLCLRRTLRFQTKGRAP
jgi:hypothetical protein